MDSEEDTSETEVEVRGSELSENGSISSTEESTRDSDYGDKKAFLEQNQQKDDNTDSWEGRTNESFEDIGGDQYPGSMTLDDSIVEHIEASDEMDDDCEYLEDIKSDDEGSTKIEKIPEDLQCRESEEGTHNFNKFELKMEEEKRGKHKRDLSILLEPGRKGWIREVVYSRYIENHVVFVNYLSPEDQDGGRRRFETKKGISSYIAQDKQHSDLTMENFCTGRSFLGLGSCYEVSRKSCHNNPGKKEYQQFFTVVEGSSPPTVTCNLCGTEKNIVRYCRFSSHMRRHHLPDETCFKCEKEIPSKTFRKHSMVCDGTETKLPQRRDYSQFYTKLQDSSPAQVSCNLCNCVKFSKSYSEHFRKVHMPRQTCPMCHKDMFAANFKKHTSHCNGSDTTLATSHECPTCKKVIKGERNFKKHTNRCNGSDTTLSTSHECPTCRKVFSHKRYLDKHNKNVHEEQKATCPNCHKEFKHVTAHLKCCIKQQKETCPNCQKEVKNIEIHSKYCSIHKKKETCPYCQKEVKNLDIHSKYCRKPKQKGTCHNCLKEVRNLEIHLMYYCKLNRKTCPNCQKEVKHLRIHSKHCGKQKYFCPKCHKISKRCLKLHLKTCGDGSKKLTSNQLIIEAISKSEEGKLTVADICLYITKTYPGYKIDKNSISVTLSTRK